MKVENVLYTDGHDVTVTDSVLKVRKRGYNLNEIAKHRFLILQPNKLPLVFCLVIGGLLTIGGAASLVPAGTFTMNFFDMAVGPNQLLLWTGIIFLLMGSTRIGSLTERYAVNITMKSGDKNVVISNRKEYITQIVHALNEAFFNRNYGGTENVKRQFTVSGRCKL